MQEKEYNMKLYARNCLFLALLFAVLAWLCIRSFVVSGALTRNKKLLNTETPCFAQAQIVSCKTENFASFSTAYEIQISYAVDGDTYNKSYTINDDIMNVLKNEQNTNSVKVEYISGIFTYKPENEITLVDEITIIYDEKKPSRIAVPIFIDNYRGLGAFQTILGIIVLIIAIPIGFYKFAEGLYYFQK